MQQRARQGNVRPVRVADPPPQYVSRRLHTEPTDKYVFDEAQEARQNPSPSQILARSLVQEARRISFTASPPAHIKPSVWSEPVDQSNTLTFPAGAPGAYQTVCTFKTPPGRWARIEHYGVQNLDPAYTYNGEILWGFRLNGRFLDQGMTDWGEQRGSMVFMRPTFILMMTEGTTLDFMARRAIAGAQQVVQMAFRGWTWRLRNNYEGTQGSVTAY
jgi:hypothetical protein